MTADAHALTSGPISGVRVVELASDHVALAGKLLADLGAEVIIVEDPGGHLSRYYGPFLDDERDPNCCLWWWHYNTSKLSVTLDPQADADLLLRLIDTADVVLEGEGPTDLAAKGVDRTALLAGRPDLIWVSVTAFGSRAAADAPPVTDLTILAQGGPLWSCGYDDHSLPPMRGGGNQGLQTGAMWAVLGTLTAIVHRDERGEGQLVDVSIDAAANVTTEESSYAWLVSEQTVQRQTGRHAAVSPTMLTLGRARDGKTVHTGVPPRDPEGLATLHSWLEDLGLLEVFPDSALLQLGVERGPIYPSEIGVDPVATEIVRASREALRFIASRLDAYEFFVEAQRRDFACAIVYSPEEVLTDPHFASRGFPTEVEHPELGRRFTYPGAPFLAPTAPWAISRRAPLIGEHNQLIIDPLRFSREQTGPPQRPRDALEGSS
jgi:crotonobetainyl-CoA:carnitine CoA-transferase CaiB-like acyl-CoA transferase